MRRANIEDVAARAGVSRSTIYRRFPTKDDLFEHVVRREAELFFRTLDRATAGCDPRQAVIEAFALGVRLVQDSPLYSRIAESEPELLGMFSRSQVFPIRQFADGIAHTLRRCGADIAEPDLAKSPTSCCASRWASSSSPPTGSTPRTRRPCATTPPGTWSRSSAASGLRLVFDLSQP
ncbi:TetR/AcrR family transcriptional regulator [Mycobacterium sp.]|uniref:TetR/AcrR family transcriptional regulator n=1 Tax=Mycobacterium sp. TaxID=1785 RepID=UPI0039C912B3